MVPESLMEGSVRNHLMMRILMLNQWKIGAIVRIVADWVRAVTAVVLGGGNEFMMRPPRRRKRRGRWR